MLTDKQAILEKIAVFEVTHITWKLNSTIFWFLELQ